MLVASILSRVRQSAQGEEELSGDEAANVGAHARLLPLALLPRHPPVALVAGLGGPTGAPLPPAHVFDSDGFEQMR